MENDGDGGDDAPRQDDNPNAPSGDDAAVVVDNGPAAGNRSGGTAFLAFAVLVAAVVHFYLTGSGSDSFLNRLDTDLLTHAELSLAAMEEGNRLAVVPSWPLRLYAVLRRDIALYGAFLAGAAFLWGLSARSRARRDAFLVHEKLEAEIRELRQRLDRLDNGADAGGAGRDDRKG